MPIHNDDLRRAVVYGHGAAMPLALGLPTAGNWT